MHTFQQSYASWNSTTLSLYSMEGNKKVFIILMIPDFVLQTEFCPFFSPREILPVLSNLFETL